ncbi:MAG: thioredoxin family protein [Phycisphaerae bacterium]|nr:thioredoxin family protein [Phycisphaerae bacterium]
MQERRTGSGLLSVSVLFVLCVWGSAWAEEAVWLDSFDKATQQAAEQDKDLFILFTGSDWCIWCKRLESEVFSQPGFGDKVSEDFVLLKLDYPKNKELAEPIKLQNDRLRVEFKEKHDFRGYPTVYLANAKGVPYAKTGYQEGGSEKYLEHLAFLKKAKPLVDVKDQWLEDYEVAKAKAKAQKKDLLIDFTGSDWCIWCIRLDNAVFSKEYFKKQAPADFVFLKLDFPQKKAQSKELAAQNKRLSDEFSKNHGFRGFPTIYLADPTGTPYGQTGYQDMTPEQYVTHLKSIKQEHLKKEKAPE